MNKRRNGEIKRLMDEIWRRREMANPLSTAGWRYLGRRHELLNISKILSQEELQQLFAEMDR